MDICTAADDCNARTTMEYQVVKGIPAIPVHEGDRPVHAPATLGYGAIVCMVWPVSLVC